MARTVPVSSVGTQRLRIGVDAYFAKQSQVPVPRYSLASSSILQLRLNGDLTNEVLPTYSTPNWQMISSELPMFFFFGGGGNGRR